MLVAMSWCSGVPASRVSRVSRRPGVLVQTAQRLLTPARGAPVTLRWRLNLQVSRARAQRGGAEEARGGVGGPEN